MFKPIRSLVCLVFVVVGLAGATPAWSGPTADPELAADYGAGYLARLVDESGVIQGDGGPNYFVMGDAALALAAAGVGGEAFDALVGHFRANVNAYAGPGTPDDDSPGRLAILIMIAVADGSDPTNFGGQDLVARLVATKDQFEPGLFGAQDPSFDGVYRQGLSLDGLAAAGVTAPADAIDWLEQQQCPDKGWEPYRPPGSPCGDPNRPVFERTNATALATEGLAAVNATPPQGDPVDWLADAQNAEGGFGLMPGAQTDANSTGLVIRAILAGGENPAAGRWADDTPSPFTALLALQIGCEGVDADRGAFDYQRPVDPDFGASLRPFATAQAVPGAAGVAFPLTPATISAAEPVVACQSAPPEMTTTTAPTTATTAPTPSTPTTVAVAAAQRQAPVAAAALPRTGSAATTGLTSAGLMALGVGGLLMSWAGLRRLRTWP